MSNLPTCYNQVNGKPAIKDDFVPCGPIPAGGAAACCYVGHICMNDGFCAFFDGSNTQNKSGFYLGACTDSKVSLPGCRKECGALPDTAVIWERDAGSEEWSCCGIDGEGNTNCGLAKGTAFKGTHQLLLQPIASINVASSLVPLASATSAVTSAPSSSSSASTITDAASNASTSATVSSAISPGAVAAIVVGILLVFSWIIAGLLLFRRRKTTTKTSAPIMVAEAPYTPVPQQKMPMTSSTREVNTNQFLQELPDGPDMNELPGTMVDRQGFRRA